MSANQVEVVRTLPGGCREQLGLVNPQAYHAVERKRTVCWSTPGLKITRLRLLSDPGYPEWDVSYCHGVLADGEPVRVELPFSWLPKRGMRAAIVAEAKRAGVYAVRTGVFHAISTLE